MKLYDSIGPNPQVVRMVLAEKGLEVAKQRVNLREAENRQPPYLAINPMGQMPALELDDGTVLTEITAISEYLEELHPSPPVIGTTALERAETRMWVRRLDLNIIEPMINGYRYGEGLSFFESRMPCIPEASPGLKAQARRWLAWLDGQMAGRTYVVGERFTLADILLYCFTTFAAKVGQPLDPAWAELAAWQARVKERPSSAA
jgi:glutathione S-transferase